MGAAEHPNTVVQLLSHVGFGVLPRVGKGIARWRLFARGIPDGELRAQALASLEHKAFHCEGGAIYAGRDRLRRARLIELIVAYQTLADYLDNLCDRSIFSDPLVFEALHASMTDALELGPARADYYGGARGMGQDGGYVNALMSECQSGLRLLPHYSRVQGSAVQLAQLYAALQIRKHGPRERREGDLRSFCEREAALAPELRWYEFAAATGSTLGLFHLFEVASRPGFDPVAAEASISCYFRWICPLHILLDYLVDREEDVQGGDLNFVAYYRDEDDAFERFRFLIDGATRSLAGLPEANFHRMIVDGLLGLYLSDGKVERQPRVHSLAKRLLRSSRPRVRFFEVACRLYRGNRASLQPPPVTQSRA
ncbi:MAG TPA: tetraprenyl-beta-curcumene synthase family protein [Polyangiaceae bacterium]|jgi:tetraprenyl-beta-curcumene synthase|nr:tetraprenyl-beta-curcumene synthase family protein [Polyangiaceae bacterium]